VLARDEVERFLKAVPHLKMRTAFITIYAAGLRVSEVVKLTARDIDSARMVIIIRQAKGRKDRYVMLSEQLLGILRDYLTAAIVLAMTRMILPVIGNGFAGPRYHPTSPRIKHVSARRHLLAPKPK